MKRFETVITRYGYVNHIGQILHFEKELSDSVISNIDHSDCYFGLERASEYDESYTKPSGWVTMEELKKRERDKK